MRLAYFDNFLGVLGVTLLSGGASYAGEHEDGDMICGQSFSNVPAAFDRLTNNPSVKFLSSSNAYLNFQDSRAGLIWTFTRETHPAHPSLVCQKVQQSGDKVSIAMEAMCGGPKKACDDMVAAFEEHHKNIGAN